MSKLSDVWRDVMNNKRKKNVVLGRGGWGGVKEFEKCS